MFPQSGSVEASPQKQVLPVQNEVHAIAPTDNKYNNKALDYLKGLMMIVFIIAITILMMTINHIIFIMIVLTKKGTGSC